MKLLPARYKALLTAIFAALEVLAVVLAFIIACGIVSRNIDRDITLAGSVALSPGDASQWSVISGGSAAQYDAGAQALAQYGYNSAVSIIQHETFLPVFGTLCVAICGFAALSYLALLACLCGFSRSMDRRIGRMGDMVEQDIPPEADYGSSSLDRLALELHEQYARSMSGGERARKDKHYMKDLLADMSHQLKTPIASMRMYLEIMQRTPDMDAATRTRFLGESMKQIERTEWLVQGLLKMARLEAGAVQLAIHPANIDGTLELAAAPFRVMAAQSGTVLDVSSCGAVFPHDTDWLAEAIGNLIKNALEHAPGGHVCVRAIQTPLTVEISVSDDGEGVSLDVLPHLFERFYSHSSGVKSGSVGLGLALAKEIVTQSGGNISVDSQLGCGTTFNLVFLRNK